MTGIGRREQSEAGERSGGGDPAGWREQLLAVMLRTVFAVGVLIAVPSAAYALYTGVPMIAVGDMLAVVAMAIITFSRRLAFAQRAVAFIAIVFLLGLWLLGNIFVVGTLYLIAAPVMAALFLGLRAARAMLALVAFALLLPGWFLVKEWPFLGLDNVPFSAWAVITLNVTFVSGMMAFGATVLLGRLEEALARQRLMLDSLEQSRDALQREIAERRQVEKENARLAQVVEQSPAAVMIVGAGGSILYRNRTSDFLFVDVAPSGFSQLRELSAVDDGLVQLLAALAAGQAWSGELLLGQGDDIRRIDAILSPFDEAAAADGSSTQDAAGVVVFLDTTAERRLEERLRQAERLEATGTLAGGIAHDFNNIVGAILALAEETRTTTADLAVHDAFERIETACSRASSIVRQMLLIGRGAEAVERRPEDVGALLTETLPLLRAVLPASVELELDVGGKDGDNGGHVARIHPADLNQVLLNLTSNAAHAMRGRPGGRFRLALRRYEAGSGIVDLHPRLRGDVPWLCLQVSDTGVGIAPEHRERIFDAFFTTKELGEGTGLGLPSVHAIVRSLGGDIGVYSEPGRGTTFRIYLPVAELAVAVAPPPLLTGADPSAPRAAPAQARILLVDDEQTILDTTARFLERAGHSVTRAGDGIEGRDLFDADPGAFDLLVTDLTMPGCSGEELIEHVHGRRADLPAILTSGFGGHSLVVDELESRQLVTYLDKPFRQAELLDRVEAALTRHGAAEAEAAAAP